MFVEWKQVFDSTNIAHWVGELSNSEFQMLVVIASVLEWTVRGGMLIPFFSVDVHIRMTRKAFLPSLRYRTYSRLVRRTRNRKGPCLV